MKMYTWQTYHLISQKGLITLAVRNTWILQRQLLTLFLDVVIPSTNVSGIRKMCKPLCTYVAGWCMRCKMSCIFSIVTWWFIIWLTSLSRMLLSFPQIIEYICTSVVLWTHAVTIRYNFQIYPHSEQYDKNENWAYKTYICCPYKVFWPKLFSVKVCF